MLLKSNQQTDGNPVELLCMLLDKTSKCQNNTKKYAIDKDNLAMLTKTLLANVDSLRQFIEYSRCQLTTVVPDNSNGRMSPMSTSSVEVMLPLSIENHPERRLNVSSHLDTLLTDVGSVAGCSTPHLLRSPQLQSIVSVTRYKTELCRQFEENGTCRYAEKCQFAHGRAEIRSLSRHPKYKTEMCRTFHTTGFCPYGLRCHFIHNDDERQTEAVLSGPSGHVASVCSSPSSDAVRCTTASYGQHDGHDGSCGPKRNFPYEPISLFPMFTMPTSTASCNNLMSSIPPPQTVPCELSMTGSSCCTQQQRGRPILARSPDEDNSYEMLMGMTSNTSSMLPVKSVTEE